jgi:hypothetical protein
MIVEAVGPFQKVVPVCHTKQKSARAESRADVPFACRSMLERARVCSAKVYAHLVHGSRC